MSEQERPEDRRPASKRPPEMTAYGVFGFAGLVLGATVGGFLFYAPGIGALAGAALGLLAAFLQARRRPSQ